MYSHYGTDTKDIPLLEKIHFVHDTSASVESKQYQKSNLTFLRVFLGTWKRELSFPLAVKLHIILYESVQFFWLL